MRVRRLDLGKAQRFQADDVGAARERIGDRPHEPQGLRAGEEKGAGTSAVPVDGDLEVTEEARRVLNLVDDDGRRIPREEGAGIAFRLLRFAGKVQRHEGMVREESPHETGLSSLAGAGEHDHRAGPGPLQEQRLYMPVNPHRANSMIQSNYLHH